MYVLSRLQNRKGSAPLTAGETNEKKKERKNADQQGRENMSCFPGLDSESWRRSGEVFNDASLFTKLERDGCLVSFHQCVFYQ